MWRSIGRSSLEGCQLANHVIGGSGKSPVCASRNLWLSCSRRGLGQATKSPIGADAVHKPVVNSEEVFWISFRPKVAELGSVIEEQVIAFHLEAQSRTNAPFHAETGYSADRVDILGPSAIIARVVELSIQEGNASRGVEE
jgi:hypothetical protein